MSSPRKAFTLRQRHPVPLQNVGQHVKPRRPVPQPRLEVREKVGVVGGGPVRGVYRPDCVQDGEGVAGGEELAGVHHLVHAVVDQQLSVRRWKVGGFSAKRKVEDYKFKTTLNTYSTMTYGSYLS